MPEMAKTTIIPNHPSCIPFMDDIYNYLTEEVQDGRMSGPLSHAGVELTLRGPFFSSPLLVSVQPQAPGTPDKIRMCKNLSKATKTASSVNSYILKESFPTHFDTASRVADIVSLLLPYPYSLHLFFVFDYTLSSIHNTSILYSIHPSSIHNTSILNYSQFTILLFLIHDTRCTILFP